MRTEICDHCYCNCVLVNELSGGQAGEVGSSDYRFANFHGVSMPACQNPEH